MTYRTTIRLAVATALGSLIIASAALAGPQMTFGPENQGTLQFEYKGQFQALARDFGSGADNTANTYNFNFRRNRLALMGTYGDIMSMYVQTEFTDNPTVGPLLVSGTEGSSSFEVLDAVMRFDLNDAFKVNVGKFKYNFSRENLEACENPLTLDRSLFIRAPFVSTRDMGIGVWGNFYKDRLQYRADMMEGRKALSAVSEPVSSFRFSGRGHISLLDPEKDYGYKGTYMGEKKVLTIGASYQFEPHVIYSDTTSKSSMEDYRGYTVDGFFEYPIPHYGTPTLSIAYENVDFGGSQIQQHPDLGALGIDGAKNGGYFKAGYLLPQLPLQLFARYERWRFALLNNVYDQRVDWTAGGANYYVWGQRLKLTAEVSNTSFLHTGTFSGLQGNDVTSKDFNTVTGQLQVLF